MSENPARELRSRLNRTWRERVMDMSPSAMRVLPYSFFAAVLLLCGGGIVTCGGVGHASGGLSRMLAVSSGQPAVAAQALSRSAPSGAGKEAAQITGGKTPGMGNEALSTEDEAAAKAAAAAELEELSREEKGLDGWLKNFQWILGLMITVTGLFTVAQGVAAGFSAERFTQRAEKDLERIAQTTAALGEIKSGAVAAVAQLKATAVSEIDALKGGIEAKYPNYLLKLASKRVEAQNLLVDVLKTLSPVGSADEGYDYSQNSYAHIPIPTRQSIHSIERALPYEIAGEERDLREYAVQLQRLARFYWSKFFYENGIGYGHLGDLERAEYLLKEGLQYSESTFTFYNDLGSVHMDFYRVMKRAKDRVNALRSFNQAEDFFLKSREVHTCQLRAYFNLAVMAAEHRGKNSDYFGDAVAEHLHKGIELLREGLGEGDFSAVQSSVGQASAGPDSAGPAAGAAAGERPWETEPIRDYVCLAYFNLGCYYARLAALEPAEAEGHVAKCLEVLVKAAEIGRMKVKDVEDEFTTTEGGQQMGGPARRGDFADLLEGGDEPLRVELQRLRKELSRNRPQRGA